MGNCESVTITVGSDVFTGGCYPARVEIDLEPDAVHHLTVAAGVAESTKADGCVYGGYTLTTKRDKDGKPLVIEQGQPAPLGAPSAVIGPENAAQLRPILSLVPEARLTTDFVFNGHDELVSVGYSDRISLWSVTTGQEQGRIGHGLESASALCVAADPDHSLIATGGTAESPCVRIWDHNSGEMRELGRHDSYLEKVAFSPEGSRLASGGNDNTVRVWDLVSGQPLSSLEGDVPKRSQAFHSLHWLDDDTLFAAGSDAVYWWDVTSGQMLERWQRPEAAAFLVEAAVRQDGGLLAAVAQDDAIYVRERRDTDWQVWAASPGLSLTHVEFSPDGSLLGATTDEGELLLWKVSSSELLARYSVASGSIAAVRFSPDGRAIAVGGWDSPISLWGLP